MTGRHPIVSREDGGDDELARLAQIDELLRRVPPVEPPAALVRETLRRVEAGQRRSRSEPRSGWRRGFVAAGVAVAALIGVRVVDMTSLEADSSPQADVAQGPITVATNTAEPTARGGEGGEQEAAQVAMVARDDLAEGQQYYLERVGPHGGVVAGLEDLGGVVDPGTDWANTIEVTKNEDGTPRDGKSGDIVQADQGYRGLVQAMDRGVVD